MTLLALAAPLFPYDPNLDSAMSHHHLLLGYAFTWGIQLVYLAYAGRKWYGQRISDRSHSNTAVRK